MGKGGTRIKYSLKNIDYLIGGSYPLRDFTFIASGHYSMEYGTFEHGADIGIIGKGKTIEEAFVGIAKAMFSIMGDLNKVLSERSVEVKVESSDLTSLMVFWLNRLITQSDLNGLIFKEFNVKINSTSSGYELYSKNLGDSIKHLKDELGIEVKGVTYSQARVYKENDLWITQCIVDV